MKTVHINIAPNIDVTYNIGQNQHENHSLLDAAEPDDIWFHVEGISSAHVIAHVPAGLSRKERGKLIKQGAVLCKSHTHKVVSQRNIPIVYTQCRHVEKTTIPGQVFATSTHTLTL